MSNHHDDASWTRADRELLENTARDAKYTNEQVTILAEQIKILVSHSQQREEKEARDAQAKIRLPFYRKLWNRFEKNTA
ncbi:uncharacterized protein FIESC28_08028 [Fusarium coffeatum]|uniref:Uncharacterized protein n=1 Tax=Fusarium coffeatum TaxID=231269 RepID=A0A366R9H6_9HYPO|nr:uncharacterized protein FIESC28_08028 [Fusarium coffeatum]RBR13821.1 hypothetical protein FIESC28_08028 [Fusarium coffeatum]